MPVLKGANERVVVMDYSLGRERDCFELFSLQTPYWERTILLRRLSFVLASSSVNRFRSDRIVRILRFRHSLIHVKKKCHEPRSTPGTITNKAWGVATEERLQAWPRTAGPPVVMNPISRQNFIVKSRPE
ncbi:unnamed protein product [Eruca vesicaria subsp. sativa]|uniref:Uncharacterized protein n=1 Tax=Eruca vesicaria subsp. sativa TaxID=29727 RepID=A0ABC8KQS8_ERUVS|nr:unnamed protein product [Eruca vesicaria subsp. sativa]